MAETTQAIPKRDPLILRILKGLALLRESGVGMVGAGLVKPPMACFEQALLAFCDG